MIWLLVIVVSIPALGRQESAMDTLEERGSGTAQRRNFLRIPELLNPSAVSSWYRIITPLPSDGSLNRSPVVCVSWMS